MVFSFWRDKLYILFLITSYTRRVLKLYSQVFPNPTFNLIVTISHRNCKLQAVVADALIRLSLTCELTPRKILCMCTSLWLRIQRRNLKLPEWAGSSLRRARLSLTQHLVSLHRNGLATVGAYNRTVPPLDPWFFRQCPSMDTPVITM